MGVPRWRYFWDKKQEFVLFVSRSDTQTNHALFTSIYYADDFCSILLSVLTIFLSQFLFTSSLSFTLTCRTEQLANSNDLKELRAYNFRTDFNKTISRLKMLQMKRKFWTMTDRPMMSSSIVDE